MKIKYIALCLLLALVSCQRDEEMEMGQVSVSNERLEASYSSVTISCDFQTNVSIQYARVYLSNTKDFASAKSYSLTAKTRNTYIATIQELTDATTYYVRYEISNPWSTKMVEEVSEFNTIPYTTPTVQTNEVTDVTYNSAIVGGTIAANGGKEITERGVVYTTTQNPTTNNTKVTSGTGIGSFTCNLTGLLPNTTYYVRAYAVNSQGTAYGEEVSFTTEEGVIDEPPSNLTAMPFSVSAGKQVTFSQGNLQYTQSSNTWSFASAQWEVIGTDNVTGGSVSSDPIGGGNKDGTALADKVDLFGWSTSATNFGVSTSTDNNDYVDSFVDWGTNKIGNEAPNTWRTLTYNEWDYLIDTRANANDLYGVAQVNGVSGLILLPDNWTCPAGVTFKSGFHSNYGVDYYAAYQTFTVEQWSKLEAAGAIFLPAAGHRYGSHVRNVQDDGDYWSATAHDDYYRAYCLYFRSEKAYMLGTNRYYGNSVRLVKDL